jgi:hypothetical protein
MADPGNVRKSQLQQRVEGGTHIAGRRGTLPDRQNNQAKTTDRPRRTLRPFIWPSVGWFLRTSPERPSFFPAIRCPAPACDFAQEQSDLTAEAGIERHDARESAC